MFRDTVHANPVAFPLTPVTAVISSCSFMCDTVLDMSKFDFKARI